ncbi:MAG: Holliday junction branch migration protein RuvA [Ignavibacteriales bacterium]|nr:Holliday junction branch migration protein RuvA [Ignavibacteriales bacterium]
MIASLTGTLKRKSPTEILVDVNGVGYAVSIPLSTFERLGSEGTAVSLLTYLHVREDALLLFGFATDEERDAFKKLISVSGIGPRLAQGILSGVSVADLSHHIATGNSAALTSLPGIGKKTAERLVLELKDKLGVSDSSGRGVGRSSGEIGIRAEALSALLSLGYQRSVAEKAIRQALSEPDASSLPLEALLKKALRALAY